MVLIVVVTGASNGGIGSALCKSFSKHGARVFATARRLDAMSDLEPLGIERLVLDVTDPASIKAAIEEVLRLAGQIDILVNNAGLGVYGAVLDLSYDDMLRQFNTNVFGAIMVTQAVAPSMIRQRGGKIIMIGSISGIAATPFAGVYCASKAALHSMSDALRMELKPFGVQVMVVAPGRIKSEIKNKSERAHANSSLSGSIYGSVAHLVELRSNESQLDATPTDEFADHTVRAVLMQHTPFYYFFGKLSFLLPFVTRWLPRWLLDSLLMKNAGLTDPSNIRVLMAGVPPKIM